MNTAIYSSMGINKTFLFSLALVSFSLFGASATPSSAQPQTDSTSSTLTEKIAQDRRLIVIAEHQKTSDAHQGYLWARLAGEYRDAADFLESEAAYNRSIQLFRAVPEEKENYATTLDNLGALYLRYGHMDEAFDCMQKGLAIRRQLDNQTNTAVSLQHLAEVDIARRKFKDAEREAAQAYQILCEPGVPNGPGTISVLLALAFARCKQSSCAQGIQDAERALEIARATLHPDSVQYGVTLVTLGFTKWRIGQPQEAEKDMLDGLQIIRHQAVPGDPILAYSLIQYRNYLQAMRRTSEVKQVDALLSASAHLPCASCSVSVYSLSSTMR